jgi:5,10-methylenetetrahydromethanopterin reductase
VSQVIQFGIGAMLPSMPAYLPWAREMERAGFDMVGYGDTQSLLPDAFVALTAMAMETERVRLCPTVSNPVTRHPAIAASAMAAIQQLSGGRTSFGIGTGDSALLNIGERPSRVDELAEYVHAFRALTAGGIASYHGNEMSLHWETPKVPIIIAAEGPRMMHLAGQIADGVFFGNGLSNEVIEDNIRRVRAGAESVGRSLDDIEMWWLTKIYFADSEEQGWQEVAYSLAASANHSFRFNFEGKFVPPEHEAALQRLQERYAAHEHNLVDKAAHNRSLVVDSGLTEFLGRRFLIAGNEPEIQSRVQEIADLGARNLFIPSLFGDPFGYAARIAKSVVRAFAAEEQLNAESGLPQRQPDRWKRGAAPQHEPGRGGRPGAGPLPPAPPGEPPNRHERGARCSKRGFRGPAEPSNSGLARVHSR